VRLRRGELEDLAVSFLVLVLLFSNFELRLFGYACIAVLTAFVFHELAHRLAARSYGYTAFYKRWDTGIALALALGILSRLATGTTWIFAAVGAVQVYAPYAYDEREVFGRIALAGPATNVAVGVVALLAAGVLSPATPPWHAARITASVNLWLALFNLFPFPPLDGWKVFRWNAGYWAIAAGLAYLLYVLV